MASGTTTAAARARSAASSGRRGSTSRGSLARATSSTQAKKLVLMGTIGTGALAIIAAYRPLNRKGKTAEQIARETKARNPFRIAVGVFVAGTLLAALAEVNPKLAAAFAMLMLTTAAFVVGGDAWQGISAVTRIEGDKAPPAIANVPTTPAPIGR